MCLQIHFLGVQSLDLGDQPTIDDKHPKRDSK